MKIQQYKRKKTQSYDKIAKANIKRQGLCISQEHWQRD